MGTEATQPKVSPAKPDAPLLALRNVTTADVGSVPGLKSVSLALKGGQIVGLAGVSGNGQAAMADVVGGLLNPN